MNVIDLFCGAGGFSEGFRQAGFEIILGIDNWKRAVESYKVNFPEAKTWQLNILDLHPDDLPKADILIGSPPCQCFSVQRYVYPKGRKIENDPTLINEFMRIVNEIKPKYWIWENVPQAKIFASGNYNILNAQSYGVPQRRKRVFVGNYPKPEKNLFKGNIAPTIIAWELCGGWKNSRGRRFSQWLNKKPTVEEMAFYMGFPENYQFLGNQKDKSIQIGNAVCPPVARAIAEAILREVI